MTRLATLSCLAAGISLIGAGWGGSSLAGATGGAALRWEDIRPALDAHPAVRTAMSEAEAARATAREARAYPNPEIEVSLGRGEEAEGGEREPTRGFEVTLPLPWPGTFLNGAAAAASERDAVFSDARGARLAAWRELRGLYWRVGYHQRRLRSLEEGQDQIARLVEVAGVRVRAGDARPLDLTRLEIEASRGELALEAARVEAQIDRAALARWIGGGPVVAAADLGAGLLVDADLEALPEIPAMDAALTLAVQRSPALQAAALRAEAAAARWRAERHARMPELALGAFHEEELDATHTGAKLALTLPLWNWNGAGVARSRAEAAAARHARDGAARDLELEAAAAHARALQARREALAYRDEILPRARAATGALERLYEIGEVGLTDLLDARRALSETEAEMLAACLAGQWAALDLTVTMGGMEDDQP